jgi:hypothetical protein
VTTGSRRYLKMKSMNVVTRPNPSVTKTCNPGFICDIPNGLKTNRKRKMNRPKTKMATTLSFEVSTSLYGFLNGLAISNYLQTNLYNICRKMNY